MNKFFCIGSNKARTKNQVNNQLIVIILTIICLQMLLTDFVFAGAIADAGLDPVATKLTGWLNGVVGKIIAVTSLIFAIIGGAIKFNPILIAGVFGVGMAAAFGPTVVNSLFTAII